MIESSASADLEVQLVQLNYCDGVYSDVQRKRLLDNDKSKTAGQLYAIKTSNLNILDAISAKLSSLKITAESNCRNTVQA